MPDDTTTALGSQPTEEPATEPAQAPAETETDWKAEARKWEQRAKQNKADLEAAAPKLAEYDALIEASKSDIERANEAANRWQSEAETWRKAAVGHRIQALAAVDFADPSDAITALAEKNYLDAGGQIDEEAIRRDLADVLDRKPHWRRPENTATPPQRVPAPNPAQGSGGGRPAADPAQELAAIIQGQLRS
jgi:hypothetical protein